MKSKNFLNLFPISLREKVHVENEFLSFYSVDASSYQIKPDCVMIPQSLEEVKKIIRFAKRLKISVTPRAAGTSLVGNSLNHGIIIDTKNFDSISVKGNSVVVGPGVSKGELDKVLSRNKKFFSPNPSIGSYCQIGGMIGNNASGSRALKYGSIIENLEKISFIDGNGKFVTLPDDKKYSEAILKISKKVKLEHFPQVTKNSCGYRIDLIRNLSESHKILAGSEGTLGVIIEAKFRIYDLPKKRKLVIIEYGSIIEAAQDCVKIINTKPAAIEFVDKKTLSNIKFDFSKNSKCLLFVEYDFELDKSEKQLRKIISGKFSKIITNEKEIQKWWHYRDSALWYSLKSINVKKRIPHVIEDAVVPLELLPKLFFIIQRLNKLFETDSIFYGHAGNGNIHVRLIADRKNTAILKSIAEKYFSQIMRIGGSITGEHGDGLARSEFVKKQYGKQNYQVFKELKNYFDPIGIFNPGKIISEKSTIINNLEKFTP